MRTKERPIENCYWVSEGRLLAGEYPRDKDDELSRRKIDALVRAGITAFIDLTRDDDRLLPYASFLHDATHHRFPVRDVSTPDSPELTKAILDTIDRTIDQGGAAYVHCWGGVGRTGVIVGCWLARHGYEGGAALARLHELWLHCPKSAWRRKSPETGEQEQYVLTWREDR